MKKILRNRVLLSWVAMTFGTIAYCFIVIFILDKGKFYAGGITGVSQIIANDLLKIPELKSVLIAGANLPLFLIAFKKVSKRFAWLSLASVVIQTIFLYIFQLLFNSGFDPFKDFVYEVVDSEGNTHVYGQMAMAILGGALSGVALGIVLKYGASTGGVDIISQAYSFKTGFPFATISLTIDLIVVFAGMLVNWNLAVGVYTVVRLVVNNISLDAMYKTYKYNKIAIVTSKPEIVKETMLKDFAHAITIYECQGGYSGEKKYTFEAVCLTYEVEDYIQKIKQVDHEAFIYYSQVKGLNGRFNRQAIS